MTDQTLVKHTPVVRTPPVDIFESDSELLVAADVPGVSRDDVELVVEAKDLRLTTNGAVNYSRTFHLPDTVDTENIGAEVRDGVLLVHLPKVPAAKPRRIDVRVA